MSKQALLIVTSVLSAILTLAASFPIENAAAEVAMVARIVSFIFTRDVLLDYWIMAGNRWIGNLVAGVKEFVMTDCHYYSPASGYHFIDIKR